MRTNIIFKILLLAAFSATAAPVSRQTIFSDGQILTAEQLNDEFDNVIEGINSVDNSQIASGASIAPSKLSASIAGDGLSRDPGTGQLSVDVDDSTLEVFSNEIRIKDEGVTGVKLNPDVVDDVTVALTADQLEVKDQSVTQIKLAPRTVATSAPAGGVAISASSGAFSTTSFPYVDITNLSVTLVTTGRPVWVGLLPVESSVQSYVGAERTNGESSGATVTFLEGANILAYMAVYNRAQTGSSATDPAVRVPCSSFSTIVFPAAGSYTYKAQIGSSNVTSRVNFCRLAAYEL